MIDFVEGNLSDLSGPFVGADHVDGGPVGDIVGGGQGMIVEKGVADVLGVVAEGIVSPPVEVLQIRHGMDFDVEYGQFIAAVGAVLLVNIFEGMGLMIVPAGTAPGSEEIDDYGFALVEELVETVGFAVDVDGCKVGSDATIGELGTALREQRQEENDRGEVRQTGDSHRLRLIETNSLATGAQVFWGNIPSLKAYCLLRSARQKVGPNNKGKLKDSNSKF